MRNRVCVALALAGLILLASCGGGNSSTSAINVAGNWQFTANSTVFGYSYTASGQVSQSGSSLSGNLSLSGTPCAQSASFTGRLSGTNLTASLDENGQSTMYTGTVSPDGNSGSGTYQSPAGGCTNGDAGTFSGQRLSMLNGMFLGSFAPANSPPAHITAQLRDDGGQVEGSAVVTNSLCFHSLSITGIVSGTNVELRGQEDKSEQIISFKGSFDRQQNLLRLTYSTAEEGCPAESGAAELRLVK